MSSNAAGSAGLPVYATQRATQLLPLLHEKRLRTGVTPWRELFGSAPGLVSIKNTKQSPLPSVPFCVTVSGGKLRNVCKRLKRCLVRNCACKRLIARHKGSDPVLRGPRIHRCPTRHRWAMRFHPRPRQPPPKRSPAQYLWVVLIPRFLRLFGTDRGYAQRTSSVLN